MVKIQTKWLEVFWAPAGWYDVVNDVMHKVAPLRVRMGGWLWSSDKGWRSLLSKTDKSEVRHG